MEKRLLILLMVSTKFCFFKCEDVCPILDPGEKDDSHTEGQLTNSQKCFLDCTRADSVDLVCENIKFLDILNNAKLVPDFGKRINVFIWNSPEINELEASIFDGLQTRMKSLNLMNLDGLTNFPMLRDMTGLDVLKIGNAMGLTQFSPEILPGNLTTLVVYQTAIGLLSVDLQEARPLNLMKTFVFGNHTVYLISEKFFHLFPNLESATIRYNAFIVSRVPDSLFNTLNPLKEFIFTDNDFTETPMDIRTAFLEKFFSVVNLAENATLDLSNNGLVLTKSVIAKFKNIRNVSALALAGNQFGQFFAAANLFEGFDNLKKLDLELSTVPKQKGLLGGLDQLEMLILRQNNLRDLTRVDIFHGCNAKLTALDLSSNMLMALPTGNFANITNSLRELVLRNNTFHTELMDDNVDMLPSPLLPHYDFSNLRILDLSFCQLQTFKGSWVTNLTNLIRLDLSCNKIKRISREFFAGLPTSLQVLNISFCVDSMQKSPKIDQDAFSALGENGTENNFRTLILSSGYFRGWILKRLLQLPATTRAKLQELDLSRNQIRNLDAQHVQGLTELTSLDLSFNFIQSVGTRTFARMTKLASLNLAHNNIISVERYNFVDLPNLVSLDLSFNRILNIDKSAFDDLPRIQSLYLGWNRMRSFNDSFVDGGGSLIHLGLQGNALSLRTYPEGCINRVGLDPLTNLQYFYVDNSTAVYVDHGTSLASLEDKIKAASMQPNDQASMLCQFGYRLDKPDNTMRAISTETEPGGSEEWTNDFLRLVVQNPHDLSPRTFVTLIPKCMSPDFKFVGNSTSDFLCPNADSKTFDPTKEHDKEKEKAD